MADTVTSISIFHQSGRSPKDLSNELIRDTSDRSMCVQRAANLLERIASGVEGGTVAIRVDSMAGVAASGSFTCVQAQCTAGDKLHFFIPGYAAPFTLTAVASTAGTDQYSIDTGDTEVAASVKAAINAMAGLRDHISADSSGGTVTWTAKRAGLAGNNIVVVDASTNAAAHVITAASGGLAITSKPSIAITFGSANITANDTLSVGGRKYTWVASASADGEITLSTTEATAATNFAAAINADATWTGLITATRVDAVVTLTWEGDPRLGKHIVVTVVEANSGSVSPAGTEMMTLAESFVLGTTATGSSVTKRYQIGGP
ncbi:MAG TPA: hypothetical protein VGK49_04740 [Ilumatobacteraceae bacterium]